MWGCDSDGVWGVSCGFMEMWWCRGEVGEWCWFQLRGMLGGPVGTMLRWWWDVVDLGGLGVWSVGADIIGCRWRCGGGGDGMCGQGWGT